MASEAFWAGLAGGAQVLSDDIRMKEKMRFLEELEKERENRAEQRAISKEKRDELRQAKRRDPSLDRPDPSRGVIETFNSNGDKLGEIPMTEHQREGIMLDREKERVGLENTVLSGDLTREQLRQAPLRFGMDQERHADTLRTNEARRAESAARADAARARAAGGGESAGLEGELAGPTAEAIQDTIDSALSMSGVERIDAPDVYDLALRAVETAANQRQRGRRIDPAVTLSTWLTNKYGDKPLSGPSSSSSSTSTRDW